ncbi:hypothetical protein GQ457_01G007890 [Hibiscus cannabinus]
MGKCQSPSQSNPPKPKLAKKKYPGFWKMKIQEKELKVLESKASEMRCELKEIEGGRSEIQGKAEKIRAN